MCSLLFCLALISGCAGIVRLDEAGKGPKVEGIVSLHGKSYPGATVQLRRAENFTLETAPVETAQSDDKGRFTLHPASGEYLLTAKAPGYFAFFGRNPLRIVADEINLSLPLAPVHVPKTITVAPGQEGLEGRILYEGAPVAGVLVQAYLEAKNGYRGQPYASSLITGQDGAYNLDLDPGRYHIVAKKRTEG